MECKDVEAVLEQEGLSALRPAAREHLAGCEGCRELLADLSAIVVAAKRIPAEEDPPERIWVSLRAHLEAEGIIRQPPAEVVEPTALSWWQRFTQPLRPRALAVVGAGVLAVAGGLYYMNRPTKTTTPNVAKSAPPATRQSESPAKVETVAPAPVTAAASALTAENTAKKQQPTRALSAAANKPSQIQ